MAKRPLTTILVVVALALVALGLGASAASAAFLPGCANPADSALNQYCETIPTPTGGQRPQAGGSALVTTLAPQIAGKIIAPAGARTPARRRLLTLPAAGQHQSISDAGPSSAAITTSPSALAPGLILALILLAVALTGIAGTRWVQQRRHGG